MEDPAGGLTMKGTPQVRHLHGDGFTCLSLPAHTASENSCHGRSKTSEEVALADASGEDTPAFVSCQDCFFKDRAALVEDVRALMLSQKKKSPDDKLPKKPNP